MTTRVLWAPVAWPVGRAEERTARRMSGASAPSTRPDIVYGYYETKALEKRQGETTAQAEQLVFSIDDPSPALATPS